MDLADQEDRSLSAQVDLVDQADLEVPLDQEEHSAPVPREGQAGLEDLSDLVCPRVHLAREYQVGDLAVQVDPVDHLAPVAQEHQVDLEHPRDHSALAVQVDQEHQLHHLALARVDPLGQLDQKAHTPVAQVDHQDLEDQEDQADQVGHLALVARQDQVDHLVQDPPEDLVAPAVRRDQVPQEDQEAHSLVAPVDQVDHQALAVQVDQVDPVVQEDQVDQVGQVGLVGPLDHPAPKDHFPSDLADQVGQGDPVDHLVLLA